ncbi:VOC family protein [Chloroflexota bacterium]
MELDASSLGLPEKMDHIAVVVNDRDDTTRILSSVFGLGAWKDFEYSANKAELMVGDPFHLKIAFTKLGHTLLEVIEPVDRNSLWAKFLAQTGGGFHHIAYNVSNWDKVVSAVEKAGGKRLIGASYKGNRWVYLFLNGIIIDAMDNFGAPYP